LIEQGAKKRGSYRFVSGVDLVGLANSDISGANMRLMLKFGFVLNFPNELNYADEPCTCTTIERLSGG
jgi:hypothetical protein